MELYLLSWLLNQTFQVYLESGKCWQLCRSYGSEKPIMRLLYHDLHYDLIQLKRRTQSTEEAKETSSSENWKKGRVILVRLPGIMDHHRNRKDRQ